MKHFTWIFLLMLAACSASHPLTVPMAQNALNRLVNGNRFAGGTATITKVDTSAGGKSAKAAITFSDLGFTGVSDEFPQRYSGPGEATFRLSNDGIWVLTKVATAEDLHWDNLNIEAQ